MCAEPIMSGTVGPHGKREGHVVGATKRWDRRAPRTVVLAAATALLATVMALSATGVRAAAAGDSVTMSTFRDLLVDPATGDVLVSGDDQIAIFDAAGVFQTAIPNVYGAGGMDIDGTTLWVAETTAAKIAEIDLTTRTVTRKIDAGGPVTGASLAVIGDKVHFANAGQLRQLDPATGSVVDRGNVLLGQFERVGTSTTTLLTYQIGNGVRRVDLSTNPATNGPSGSGGSNLRQIAVDASTGRYVFASGAPYHFGEVDIATMTETGVSYAGTNYPAAIAYSPGHGGLLAGATQSTNRVFVSQVGNPASVATFSFASSVVYRAIGISLDGSSVYVLREGPSGTKVLSTFSTAPTISGAIPGWVVADVPTPVTVTGSNLNVIESVTVGGLPAAASVQSPTQAVVTVPVGLPVGPTTMVITTPLGSTSTELTVTPNTGATLTGTVRRAGSPVSGIEVELSGGALGSPLTTTSAGDGTYSFSGLGYGTTYRLETHDPSGTTVDQATSGLVLTPNGTTTRDVVLASNQTGPGPILSTTPLPGQPRDLLVETTTDRAFVSVGDEVLAFDRDGDLLARFSSLWGADGLTTDGTDVYVNLRTGGAITRIDAITLTVTGSWPTQRVTTGGLAFAGGRLWYSNGDNQWCSISSLDPDTGIVTDTGGSRYRPRFRSVEGAPGLFYLWEEGISPNAGYLYDGTGAQGSVVRSASSAGSGGAPSASLGRLWTPNGWEWDLNTFTQTGVKYPSTGWSSQVALSTARGGVLGIGPSVAKVGAPVATHTVPSPPMLRGFDSGADRLLYATSSSFAVMDLHPRLVSISPAPVYTDVTSITLTGSGLATTTSVWIDGSTYPFTATGTDKLTVTVPGLTVGQHSVHVETAWGASDDLAFVASVRPPPPVVTNLAPTSVPTKGGTVTITGTGFTAASSVSFGSTAATSTAVVDDTTITATAPAHLPATTTVTVTTEWGASSGSPDFSWVAPTPAVTGVSPPSGPPTGGTLVTVSGSGFVYASAVTVGGTPVSFTPLSDSSLRFTAPAHAPGPVTIGVTTPGGTSAAVPSAGYVYDPVRPTITSMSPTQGATAGGYQVLISGSNLTDASSVTFGAKPAQAFTVVSPTTIVATVPPGSAGAVTVTIVTPLGTSLGGPDATFTYIAHGSSFHGLTPTRVLDSRTTTGGWVGPLPAGSPRTLAVAGVNGIPAEATAVVANLTVTDPTAESFLTAYPTGTALPNASNLNYRTGETVANLATIRVGTGGTITLANAVGATNVVVDVVGYYAHDDGELYNGITPSRVLDSRIGVGWSGPLVQGAAGVRTLTVTGGEVPATATSLVLNLTVTDSNQDSFVQVWPTGATRPSSSNLNFLAGSVRANLVTVKIGTGGGISFFNAVGSTNVVADVVGYYDPAEGAEFHPLAAPARFLDDRVDVGTSGPWQPGETRVIGIGVDVGVPAGASAVVFNTTVTNASAHSYLTVFPPMATRPVASTVNFSPYQATANLTIVPVEPDDAVSIYNNVGTVDVIGDAVGYFTRATP